MQSIYPVPGKELAEAPVPPPTTALKEEKDTCAWSIIHLHRVKSVWGRLVRAFSRIWAVTVV
jgi:hypothetical protein